MHCTRQGKCIDETAVTVPKRRMSAAATRRTNQDVGLSGVIVRTTEKA